MSNHSAIMGGSTADRILNCPASYQEQLRSPVSDAASVYAQEGSLLHEMIAFEVQGQPMPNLLTPEQVEVVKQALAMLGDLKKQYGGRFKVIAVEETLPLPGVTGAFGSVDLVLANKSTVIVLDWKFGAGVPVKALYEHEDGDQLNPQLAFYTAAARARHPKLFRNRAIICAIVQPRLDPPVSYTETNHVELDEYLLAFRDAYIEALGRDPHHAIGPWCRFARCKVVCPLWTAPVFDLTAIDPTAIQLQASQTPEAGRGYGGFLSRALDLAGFAEDWAAEVRRQAHVYLEGGGVVDGWKLVPKRGTRQWLDLATVVNDLTRIGARGDDIFTSPGIRSVAQAENALKKRGIEVPAELWRMVSTGTTIARADDGRPASNEAEVVEELRKALTAL